LASTSAEELAAALLEECLRGGPVSTGLVDALAEMAASADEAVALAATRALFSGLVEPLADRFEPRLCEAYVQVFSRVMERANPEWEAAALAARYGRVRRFRHFDAAVERPERVYVLSRVTLGADVAITSVMLDAAKRRFPAAEIYFVGDRKGWELFAADARIAHLPVAYGRRATLRERLETGRALRAALAVPRAIVIDPDSRLSQLGLLPLCDEERYYFFESRAYGGEGDESLSRLAMRWVAEVFGVADAVPYVAPLAEGDPGEAGIAVSLGVGENLAKRLPDPFEERLLAGLARKGLPLVVDRGAGGEEARRVDRALGVLGPLGRRIRTWDGSFAGFAWRIARSRLFVGYDSAGQHVAAACGVPLVSIFAGYVSQRTFLRWQPSRRERAWVVAAEGMDHETVLGRVLAGVERCLGGGIASAMP